MQDQPFSEWLRSLREERLGMTQRALGEMLGVDDSLISKLETGALRPSNDFLEVLLRLVGESSPPPLDRSQAARHATVRWIPVVAIAMGIGVALASSANYVWNSFLANNATPTPVPISVPAATPNPTPTIVLPTPTLDVVRIPVIVPPGVQAIPPLPQSLEYLPADAPWKNGDVVLVVPPLGALLRPYPVGDDTLAEYLIAIPYGAELRVASNLRWTVQGEAWWYVRYFDPEIVSRPRFGWLRQELVALKPGDGPRG